MGGRSLGSSPSEISPAQRCSNIIVERMLDSVLPEGSFGLSCNSHALGRTFACLLRKADIDTMTIRDLGRWEFLEMVQTYTRSVTFEDSLKHYRAPLS